MFLSGNQCTNQKKHTFFLSKLLYIFVCRDTSSSNICVENVCLTRNQNDGLWHYLVYMYDNGEITLMLDPHFDGTAVPEKRNQIVTGISVINPKYISVSNKIAAIGQNQVFFFFLLF